MTLVRVRLDLSYDGTDFAGWARQPGLRTVQGTLESALGTVLRIEPPRLTVAGRTDAGVHARGQVAHFDAPPAALSKLGGRLVRRLSGLLPADLVVRRASAAPEGFDARFSALHRSYAYRLVDEVERVDPLRRRYVVVHPAPLDATAMSRAAVPLVGLHDFAAYCRARPDGTTVRTLQALRVERPEAGPDAGLVVVTVQADAFCHQMVRSLVGALLAVGDGRRPTPWPAELLAGGRRHAAVAPAHGLTLEAVAYPDASELADRAEATRAWRAL